MLKDLSDELLLESYYQSIRLGLDRAFILMLTDEIERRNLSVKKNIKEHIDAFLAEQD